MAKHRSPGENGGAAGFEAWIYILNFVFWVPTLYIVFVPWLSFAVIKKWPEPIFAGFFNAMASTGWLVVSVLVVIAGVYAICAPSFRAYRAKRKKAHTAE
ncbi:hypothetical protein [Pseudomonas putida]|uniref:hypothetical protein n=1 Tax=Pseudomonas putida TaxID=303 RepID=UPI0038213B27